MDQNDPPRVFISYSWTTEEHTTWVRGLAERLSSDGVHVTLDQWDLKEGHDKYAFMERMVSDVAITKVLIICDKRYKEKADSREGGVGTESLIVSPEIYGSVSQEKFIPIVREVDTEGAPYLPAYLKGRMYIDLAHNERFHDEYERLLRNIYDRPLIKRPPLGNPPSHLFEPEPIHLKVSHKLDRIKDAFLNEKPVYKVLIREYLRTLSEALEDFRMDLSDTSMELDDKVMGSIEQFMPYRNDFIDLTAFCAFYIDTEEVYTYFFDFFEDVLPYLFKSGEGRVLDNYKFILYELFLYYVTVLLKERRFDAVDKFLSNVFVYSGTAAEHRGKSWHYSIFNHSIYSIEETRKRRLELRWFSYTGQIIKERANRKEFDFERLMEVDYLLFVRSVIHLDYTTGRMRNSYWYPRCLPYAEDHRGFAIFLRAAQKKYFQDLRVLLGVVDKEELVNRWNLVRQNIQLNQIGGDWVSPEALLCLDTLDTQ